MLSHRLRLGSDRQASRNQLGSQTDRSQHPDACSPGSVLERLTAVFRVGIKHSGLLSALLAISIAGLSLTACDSATSAGSRSTQSSTSTRATNVIAAPAGLLAGAQPQPNGVLWLLAGDASEKTLEELNLTTGKINLIVPESKSAISVAQLSSGIVGVGLATQDTGSLELHDGSSGALLGSVPIGAPVMNVASGPDAQTFYVVNGNATTSSVTVVNAQSAQASMTVPVPIDTISVAADPSGQQLYSLGSGGAIRSITLASGTVSAKFGNLINPVAMVLSDSGSTLYVLKNTPNGANVALLDLATERQTTVLPVARNSVGLQLSPDNRSLYDIVGTAQYGNVQVFPLSP